MRHVIRFWETHKLHHWPLLVGSLLLFFAVLIGWHDSLRIPYIGDHFSYSADLNATDNSYDTAQNRYDGPRYSNSSYFIESTQSSANVATLMSQLKTVPTDTSSIGTISRNYNVNSQTGQHLSANGTPTPSYLFAPRDLAKGRSFTYWHVTYNRPATMKYVGAQQLFGLKTYEYNADYSQADRLVDNVNVAGTPPNQGTEYAPTLKIWVEPTTGWLIKYQENTTVYYFNKTTGQRLGPADHFTNSFTEASVRQQVDYARELKYQLDFGREIAPSILIVTALVVLSWLAVRRLRVRAIPIVAPVAIVLALSGANIAGWLLHITTLITLFEPSGVINSLASICFLLTAVSILLLYKQRYQRFAAGLCIAVCIVTITQALSLMHVVPFYIDMVLFHKTAVDIGQSTPDHVSLFGTLTIFILASATLRALTAKTALRRYAPRLAAGIVVSLGVAGILAKIFLLDQIFVDASIANLSIGGLALCILSGLALLLAVLTNADKPISNLEYLRALAQPALITMPLIAIGVVAQLQQNHITQQLQSTFNTDVSALQTTITTVTKTYASMVVSGQTLFHASHSVEPSEWNTYVLSLDLPQNYPGVQTVGYVTALSKADLAAGKSPVSSLFPTSNAPTYAPVTYVEPSTAQTARAVGYDMYTDPKRASAMHTALVTNEPAVTSKLSLFQDTGSATASGFVMFVPVYTNGVPTATLAEREAALQGYVYATFDAQAYFAATLSQNYDPIDVTVYDGFAPSGTALLYGSDAVSQPVDISEPRETKSTTLALNNHPWELNYTSRTDFRLSIIQEGLPAIILFGGGILYLVIIDVYLWLKALTRMLPGGKAARTLARIRQPRANRPSRKNHAKEPPGRERS